MKIAKRIFTGVVLLVMIVTSCFSQDVRTVRTKVVDLLALMPSGNPDYTNRLMVDMISLGDEGLKEICSQVIPAGTGDDIRPRFAVESMSRYLSQFGKDNERAMWEKLCISFAAAQKDHNVKDFFMKQLQLIGGDASIEAVKGYLSDKDLCDPAVAVIGAAGGKLAEKILADALKDRSLPCAAGVINTLAIMKSDLAINEFLSWSASNDYNIRAAAFNALAVSGNPLAYQALSKAARDASYKWEPSGAVESLLVLARISGQKGDVRTLDKICKTVSANCNDKNNIQYKISALEIDVSYFGYEAMPRIIKAVESPDKSYRTAALGFSLDLAGSPVTRKWIEYFPQAIQDAKPEIVHMLGIRKDIAAVSFISGLLADPAAEVRKEAAAALVSISGKDAIGPLSGYLVNSVGQEDQEAAKTALMTVLDERRMPVLLEVIKTGSPQAIKSSIELLAWSKQEKYFTEVFRFISSDNEPLRIAAYKALADLAGPADLNALLDLLDKTEDPGLTGNVQDAIANAANQITDQQKRSDLIIRSLKKIKDKGKVIPVLPRTGGREALGVVLDEFENGGPEMRDICFAALTSWKDYTASSALYEICASRNKTFESKAFAGYVRQIRSAPVPSEQKLLLYRKIMPYALSTERKNQILNELKGIKTYQCLFFAASYLDDPSTAAAAASAVISVALPAEDNTGGMYGAMVKDILSRAMEQLRGPESEYEKEQVSKYLGSMNDEEGFTPMFNGTDLSGWQGLVENPVARAKMTPAELARKQEEANRRMTENWSVRDGCIYFSGNGDNLCSIKKYADFELLVDWKITKLGDSGIYLRGSPQVQIWDTSRTDVGAQVGSGGLYNNQKNPSKPLEVADNQIGDWNSFRIIMVGEKVSVWLNGILVVDDVVMENYWDRKIPIFPEEAIELQAHGNELAFRDIYVREINEKVYNLTSEEKAEGFETLFNGRNLDNWIGNKEAYMAEDGMIVIKPDRGGGGNLYTSGEYSDFLFRFEFQLTPGGNNGLGIRAPLSGDAAYVGMEIQILDNTASIYANIDPWQAHGSVYGVIPAKRGYLKPVGEWNFEEVYVMGTRVKVVLNGTVIVDGDIAGPRDNGTMDNREHPGLTNTTGHIGFLGHGSVVKFRNIRIKDLSR